jgi:hypothetical protein
MPPPDGPPPIDPNPSAIKLAGPGTSIVGGSVMGGWVAYLVPGETPTTNQLFAVPANGSMTNPTALASDVVTAQINGEVLVAAHAQDAMTDVATAFFGKVGIWKNGMTALRDVAEAVYAPNTMDFFFLPIDVSPDGTKVTVNGNYDPTGMMNPSQVLGPDVLFVSLETMDPPVVLVENAFANGGPDDPFGFFTFNGSSVILASSTSGMSMRTLQAISVTNPANRFTIDSAQARFALSPTSNEIVTFSQTMADMTGMVATMYVGDITMGAMRRQLDTSVSLRSRGFNPVYAPDASGLAYFSSVMVSGQTGSGTLKYVATAMGGMARMIEATVQQFDQFSPNGRFATYFKTFNTMLNGGQLKLANVTTGEMVADFGNGSTTYQLPSFSGDSQSLVYYTNIDAQFTGDLRLRNLVSPAATDPVLASKVWAHGLIGLDKIVYNDNTVYDSGLMKGYGDIRVSNLSSMQTTLLQERATISQETGNSEGFAIFGNNVLFILNQNQLGTDGLYTIAIP